MNTDAGPAFPMGYHPDGNSADHEGMSLRDWFAGQALAWCLSEFAGNAEDMKQPAEAAYQVADAMLRARERGQEGGGR